MSSVAEQVRGRPLPFLKLWRMHRFITQSDLIAASGLSRATVVRAERGDMTVGFSNIKRLAEALGITPEELTFTEPSEPTSGVYPAVERAEQHSEGKEEQENDTPTRRP